jgi:hypothetical protein
MGVADSAVVLKHEPRLKHDKILSKPKQKTGRFTEISPRLGYFVLNHATVASSQSLLAQLWKEYALSDSRYLTSNFFMLSVESITVVSPDLYPPFPFLLYLSNSSYYTSSILSQI